MLFLAPKLLFCWRTIVNTEELSQIATAHQSAIIRHEQWLADHTTALARHEQWKAEQEAAIRRHERWKAEQEAAIARHEQWKAEHEAAMRRIDAQQELNIQAIAQFTAGLEELRILVTNYIRGRENL